METEIFKAIENGCMDTIRTFFSQEENVNLINTVNAVGYTWLQIASHSNHKKIVKYLIDMGADVNLKNFRNKTALNIAIDCNNISVIETLVDAGADVNTLCHPDNTTALHSAAETGSAELVQFLVSHGADVNARTKGQNWTALHFAAANVFSENPIIFETLLSANAEVDALNDCKETPLQLIIQYTPSKIKLHKIVEVFKKYGADFDINISDSLTLIDLAIVKFKTEAVKALVHCSALDVNKKDLLTGETILHGACSNLDLPTVKFLLKEGADINSLDIENVSSLKNTIDTIIMQNYCERGSSEGLKMLKYLLKKNPDINTITISGQNILNPPMPDLIVPNFLWKTILQHIAKLHAIGNSIHTKLLETITKKLKYKKYFEKCNQELEIAKCSKIDPDSWVTYLHLLINRKEKLVYFAANKKLVENFIQTQDLEKFPIFGTEIQTRFLKALKIQSYWDQAAVSLSDLIPITVDPTHRIIIKILSFLKVQDLQKLCL